MTSDSTDYIKTICCTPEFCKKKSENVNTLNLPQINVTILRKNIIFIKYHFVDRYYIILITLNIQIMPKMCQEFVDILSSVPDS